MSGRLRFLKAIPRNRTITPSLVLAWAAGLGLGGAVLGTLFGTRSMYADPLLRDATGLPEWRGPWRAEARSAGVQQEEAFRLLVVVALVLAVLLVTIALVNLATLLLTRAAGRRSELSMRAALGASPRRLVEGLLREGSGLVVAGGLAGLVVAALATAVLRRSWPSGPWPLQGATPAAVVGLCFGGFAVLTLACWLFPLSAALRSDLRRFLDDGQRATPGPGEGVLRNGLVVLQIAASLVLLVLAGVLVRGFAGAGTDRVSGFDPGGTLTLRAELPAGRYGDAHGRSAAYAEMLRRVDALPGVVDSSAATQGASLGIGVTERVTVACVDCSLGGLPRLISQGNALVHAVAPGFFQTLGATLLRGREFRAIDGPAGAPTIIINDAFAYRLFPNGEPLGKWVRLGGINGVGYQVIGVVKQVGAPAIGAAAGPTPAAYLSMLRHPPLTADLVVRTTGDPAWAATRVVQAIRTAGGAIGATDILTLRARLARFRAPLAWFGALFATLALGALLVATSSLYGVTTYGIERRRREIGIRMAIGATAREVLALIVGQSARVVALGSVLGLMGALGLARLLQQRIPGIDVLDPWVYAPISLLLAAVAVLASYRPARRAAQADPQLALRESTA